MKKRTTAFLVHFKDKPGRKGLQLRDQMDTKIKRLVKKRGFNLYRTDYIQELVEKDLKK